MDWKLFAPTFRAVFLAELGAKTQLAALPLSAGAHSKGAGVAGSARAPPPTPPIPRGPRRARGLPAVSLEEIAIEDDEVRTEARRRFDRLVRGGHFVDVEASLAERRAVESANVDVILDEEDEPRLHPDPGAARDH